MDGRPRRLPAGVAEGTRTFYKTEGKSWISESRWGNCCNYTLQPLPSSPGLPHPPGIHHVPRSLPLPHRAVAAVTWLGSVTVRTLFHCCKCHLSYTLPAFHRRPIMRQPFKNQPSSRFMFSHFYYMPDNLFPPDSPFHRITFVFFL